MGAVAGIYSYFHRLFRLSKTTPYNEVPDRDFYRAIKYPEFKKKIIECSIEEDEENSYYMGMLNTIAENCVGSTPMLLGKHPVNSVNDDIEDTWLDWCVNNSIGAAIREIRRAAARTGLGIAIPYEMNNSEDAVPLGFKTICVSDLKQPFGALPNDRIIDGVEYDENWDIKTVYIDNGTLEPTPYDAKDIIVWHKRIREGLKTWAPECGPAFTLFPSVKRFMKAIVRGEEMRACVPMAIKLDPGVYKPDVGSGTPRGNWEYEPGMVPTLPPGAELSGVSFGNQSAERNQFIHLVIGAAARCVQMPKNIALGDSSGHNMATAAIDIIPWNNRVKIDRTDFQPVVRKIFRMWSMRARRTENYLLPLSRRQIDEFKFDLNYDVLFNHPDPKKNADSRSVDLKSGATTLARIYKDQGLNGRRELAREARELGITLEQLYQIILTTRTTSTLNILPELNDGDQ